MNASILNGNKTAQEICAELSQRVSARLQQGLAEPTLAVILLGNDPASKVYVHHKRKDCQRVGIRSLAYDLSSETPESQLLDLIEELNQDPSVNGVLVQLPLPDHISSQAIINRIDPHKDVDGFHPYNVGCLALRQPELRPCTPFGIITLLKAHHIPLEGVRAVVVGASNIVGRPMALELLLEKATVTICHRFTQSLEQIVETADLLVVAVGKRALVHSEWIKPGAVVVDVGIHRLQNQTITGDLDFETAAQRANWITPVPGGVGPMTRAMLLVNTLAAAEIQDLKNLNN